MPEGWPHEQLHERSGKLRQFCRWTCRHCLADFARLCRRTWRKVAV